jgi:hypothetical protein
VDFDEIDGPVTEEVQSKGVVLVDGVWKPVIVNVACLLRVGTVTHNNKYRRIGLR